MSAFASWAAGIRRIHAAAAGLVALHVVRAVDAPGLMAGAERGDTDAARLMVAADLCLQGIARAPADAPAECSGCHVPLREGRYSIVVACPAADPIPAEVLTLAICQRCGPTLGAIHPAAARALRELWPDYRPVTLTDADRGRA